MRYFTKCGTRQSRSPRKLSRRKRRALPMCGHRRELTKSVLGRIEEAVCGFQIICGDVVSDLSTCLGPNDEAALHLPCAFVFGMHFAADVFELFLCHFSDRPALNALTHEGFQLG